MPTEQRTVDVVALTVCEAGHVKAVAPGSTRVVQFRHTCGHWTWADGNFCISCGADIRDARN